MNQYQQVIVIYYFGSYYPSLTIIHLTIANHYHESFLTTTGHSLYIAKHWSCAHCWPGHRRQGRGLSSAVLPGDPVVGAEWRLHEAEGCEVVVTAGGEPWFRDAWLWTFIVAHDDA